MCSVWLYVTSVPCALFCICSVWFFWYVSGSRSVLNVFCLIVGYVSALRNVLYSFFLIFVTLVFYALFWMCFVVLFCHVSASGTVFYVFHRLFVTFEFGALLPICDASVLRTVWYEFSWEFVTLISRALFCICFVDSMTLVPCAVFFMCSILLFGTLMPCALFWMCFVRFLSRECLAHRFECVLYDCLVS